jgi:hypothetical protein
MHMFDLAGELLRPGDHILAANGRPLSMLSHYVAWNYLKSLPEGNITLLVRRPGATVAAPRSGVADSSAVPCRYVAADRNSVGVGMESDSATRRTVT